jgi:hypothetical protein
MRQKFHLGRVSDSVTEARALQQSKDWNSYRDGRAKNRALSKRHGIVSDLIAEAGNEENDVKRRIVAARRVMRHATSVQARVDAFHAAMGIEDEIQPEPKKEPVELLSPRSTGELR